MHVALAFSQPSLCFTTIRVSTGEALLPFPPAEQEVGSDRYCDLGDHRSLLLCNRNSSLSLPVSKHCFMKENKLPGIFVTFNKMLSQALRL